VVVTQSGPLTEDQLLWAGVLACGPGGVLAGLTAARLDGLAGFEDPRIYVLVPASRQVRVRLPGVALRRSRSLGPAEVDGLWHMEAAAWWADMRRDNDLTISGYRVLRFPAFAVRDQSRAVAGQISAALRLPVGC
jgi:hypothetical protein